MLICKGSCFECVINFVIVGVAKLTCYQFNTVDDYECLQMLQCTAIYIVLRVFDRDSFKVDFDARLVDAMTEIAMKLEITGFMAAGEIEGYRPQWQEWIHMESKRR